MMVSLDIGGYSRSSEILGHARLGEIDDVQHMALHKYLYEMRSRGTSAMPKLSAQVPQITQPNRTLEFRGLILTMQSRRAHCICIPKA